MSRPAPLQPGLPYPKPPGAQILAAAAAESAPSAATAGLPAAVVADRAIQAWAQLATAAEAVAVRWSGSPDADHLDQLTVHPYSRAPSPRPRSVAAPGLDVRPGAGGSR